MDSKYVGLLVGFLFALTIVYALEAYEEIIEDEDYLKGGFFIIAFAAHIVISYMIFTNPKKIHYIIISVGTIGLIILYIVTHLDADHIGSLAILSKIIQVPIIIVAIFIYKSIK